MAFAEHQTFHIREGWLYKGMSAIKRAEQTSQLPSIFLDDDAPERLGIGRNMVRALRFWMQATGLTEEKLEGRSVQRLTNFGEQVWSYDPYLEDDGTLWLIHHHLVCSLEQATTWYWFFNHYAPISFSDEQMLDALSQWVVTKENERQVARSSLQKDVGCFLRTYLADPRPSTPENLMESPLAKLGIITQGTNGVEKRYYFQRFNGTSLDPLILLYVLLDRQEANRPMTAEVTLNQVLQEPMNVGRVFNLTTATLTDLIGNLNKQHLDWPVRFVRTAGLDQLTLPRIKKRDVLERYYNAADMIGEVTK